MKKKQHRSIDEPWEVSAEKETELVRWLHKFLTETMTAEKEGGELEPMIVVVRRMMEADPEKWWAGHHFFWGMWMRNQLRSNGFGEKDLNVGNLDDYYISFVEQAVNLGNETAK